MWGCDPRTLMFAAAAFDLLGQDAVVVAVRVLQLVGRAPMPLEGQALALPVGWTLFHLFLYPTLGWLFGSLLCCVGAGFTRAAAACVDYSSGCIGGDCGCPLVD